MIFENPITFVRAIKGTPASVLWALLFTRRPMTNQELQRWTGYGRDAIASAARLLVDLGWVAALSPLGPWSLLPGRQFALAANLDNLPEPESFTRSTTASELHPALPAAGAGPDPDDAKEDIRFVRNLWALFDAGIHEPTAGRLARLPHIAPEYIAAHVEYAAAQGLRLGTAIYRMERARPAPAAKPPRSVEALIRKFLGEHDP